MEADVMDVWKEGDERMRMRMMKGFRGNVRWPRYPVITGELTKQQQQQQPQQHLMAAGVTSAVMGML